MKQNIPIHLSDRDHILKRPFMYVGGVDSVSVKSFYIESMEDEEGEEYLQYVYGEKEYIPGLLKIINEILDNSLDEAIKTDFKYSNKISVTINIEKNEISIEDNGRGIPINYIKELKLYTPAMCWGKARSGSNFEDDNERDTAGLFGVGSYLTNIYSTKFIGDTCDGEQRFKFYSQNNAGKESFELTKDTKKGTKVIFYPDLSKFNLSILDEVYVDLIRQRLYELSIVFPKVKFSLNGDKVSLGSKKYLSLFEGTYEFIENENCLIAVLPNQEEEFKCLSYVNGLRMSEGSHVDFVINDISNYLKENIKQFPLKLSDIKNKLQLIIFFRKFKNAKFDGNTKENLTNSFPQIKEYLGDLDLNKLYNKVLKNEDIINPIIEQFKIREELKLRLEVKKNIKTNKKFASDKYYESIGESENLVITEGLSACTGLMNVLGRDGFGYYAIRGKFISSYNNSIKKIINNKEVIDLCSILNIDLSEDNQKDIKYKNIIIATDQDLDGISIRMLLLSFFYKFCKNLLEEKRILFLETPILVEKRENKIKEYFMSLNEFKEYETISNLKYEYKKGLGSWKDTDLIEIIESKGLEFFLRKFVLDEDSEEDLLNWVHKSNPLYRRKQLQGKSFDIYKV